MTPAEVNMIIDSKRPRVINGVKEDDYENMMIHRQKLIDDGVEVL